MSVSGLLVVDKPSGPTSHDVVARVRRRAGTRKVGHAGTLDPMATGVLLLGLGRATRLLGHIAATDKAYDATVRLGASTSTDDAQGEVLSTAPQAVVDAVTPEQVEAAAAAFRGEISQVPSAVSAVKVGGRRAHRRVRSGEVVDLPARTVTVARLDLGTLRRPEPGVLDLPVSVRCSSGTYVRALARDLGEALGVGGHLTSLRRTAVGGITIAEAHPLAELLAEDSAALPLLTLGEAARRFFWWTEVDDATARDVAHGRPVALPVPTPRPTPDAPVALLSGEGSLLALYRRRGDVAVPVAVLCGPEPG